MNSRILTIVIPTYNMEQYLHRCLDSLIVDGGHLDLLEVLVINDGSKDGSSLIAHGYQERYPELFRVIDKENGNYGSCVNRGLREAQGKYVKVLDADDRFFTEGLTVLLDNLCRQDADLVLTDYLTENLKGKVLSERQYHLVPGRTLDFDEVCLAKSLENFQMHGVCYKRRFLLSIGYRQTEGISYTDQEWVFMPMAAIRTVYYVPQLVYCYLRGRLGQTMDPSIVHRTLTQQLELTYINIKFFLQFRNNLSLNRKKFLMRQLRYSVKLAYKFGILFGDLKTEELMDFDNFLLTHEKYLYDYAGGLFFESYWKYQYVKEWRKAPKDFILPRMVRLILLLGRLPFVK